MHRRTEFSNMAGRHSLPLLPNPPDEWDPMSEDFRDPNFNTYRDGPGSRLDANLQPWNSRRSGEHKEPRYKLHITNVPVELTEQGLINLFLNCGQPVDVYKHPQTTGSSTTWAFINFSTHGEAEFAIRTLNGKPPFCLRVQFARGEGVKQRIRHAQDDDDRWKTSLAPQPYVQIAKASDHAVIRNDGAQSLVSYRSAHSPRYCGIPRDSRFSNYYSSHDPESGDELLYNDFRGALYDDSNRTMMEGCQVSVSSDNGERRVAMGRGIHARDEAIARHRGPLNKGPKGNLPVKKIVDLMPRPMVMENFEYGVKPSVWDGYCMYCEGRTTYRCSRCTQWFCSKACQVAGWRMHSGTCIRTPVLEDVTSYLGFPEDNIIESKDECEDCGDECVACLRPASASDERSCRDLRNGVEVTKPNKNAKLRESDELSGTIVDDEKLSERSRKESSVSDKSNLLSSCGRQENVDYSDCQQDLLSRPGESEEVEMNDSIRSESTTADENKVSQLRRPREDTRGKLIESRGANNSDVLRQKGLRYENEGDDGLSVMNNGHVESEKENGLRKSERKRQSSIEGGDRSEHNIPDRNSSSRNGLSNQNENGRENAPRNDGPRKNQKPWELTEVNAQAKKDWGNQKSGMNSSDRNNGRGGGRNEGPKRNAGNQKQRSSTDSSNDKNFNRNKKGNSHEFSSQVNRAVGKDQSSNLSTDTSEERLISTGKERLSTKEFIKVRVCEPFGPMVYSVINANFKVLFEKIIKDLRPADRSPAVKPNVGVLCAHQYGATWMRAKIVEVTPRLKIEYLDIALRKEVTDVDSLRMLPETSGVPGLGILIKLAPGTPEKYVGLCKGHEMKVKLIEQEGDFFIVQVEDESEPQRKKISPRKPEGKKPPANSDSTIKPLKTKELTTLDSAVNLLKDNMSGLMQVQVVLLAKKFLCSILCAEFEKAYSKVMGGSLSIECDASPNDESFKPREREIVAAKSLKLDSWLRAYVLSIGSKTYLVAFCDTGHVERVNEVKVLSEEYSTIPEMVVHVTVLEYIKSQKEASNYLKVAAQFDFDGVQHSENRITVVLRSIETEEQLCKVELTRWTPPFKHKLKTVELKDGLCILSVFQSIRDMYVRPLYKSAVDVFNTVVQDVNAHCYYSPNLNTIPAIGDLIASKFASDGNFYRAVVMIIDADKITVSYVDFGNTEVVMLDSLKPLTEELKSHPCCAVKIQLKNLIDKPLTKEVVLFMSNLTAQETQLKLTVADSKSNIVEVFLPDGTRLNEKLNVLMEPSWVKSVAEGETPESGHVYMFEEMQFLKVPINETVQIAVLHVLSHDTVVGCVVDESLIAHVHGTMVKQMFEYCTTTPQKSYVPRVGELCIAKYGEEWYRAVCLKASQGQFEVAFVDYGNHITTVHTSVRKMIEDFYRVPVFAVSFVINGIKAPVTEKLVEKLKTLIAPDVLLDGVKVLNQIDVYSYNIEIPSVISALKSEGLLS